MIKSTIFERALSMFLRNLSEDLKVNEDHTIPKGQSVAIQTYYSTFKILTRLPQSGHCWGFLSQILDFLAENLTQKPQKLPNLGAG